MLQINNFFLTIYFFCVIGSHIYFFIFNFMFTLQPLTISFVFNEFIKYMKNLPPLLIFCHIVEIYMKHNLGVRVEYHHIYVKNECEVSKHRMSCHVLAGYY